MAQTFVYNGSTCFASPPYQASYAQPYLNEYIVLSPVVAFCHLSLSSSHSVDKLCYILFSGKLSTSLGDPLRVRLCVYQSFTRSCGPEKSVTSSFFTDWVAPPTPPLSFATGAFLMVYFPSGRITTISDYIAVW